MCNKEQNGINVEHTLNASQKSKSPESPSFESKLDPLRASGGPMEPDPGNQQYFKSPCLGSRFPFPSAGGL